MLVYHYLNKTIRKTFLSVRNKHHLFRKRGCYTSILSVNSKNPFFGYDILHNINCLHFTAGQVRTHHNNQWKWKPKKTRTKTTKRKQNNKDKESMKTTHQKINLTRNFCSSVNFSFYLLFSLPLLITTSHVHFSWQDNQKSVTNSPNYVNCSFILACLILIISLLHPSIPRDH